MNQYQIKEVIKYIEAEATKKQRAYSLKLSEEQDKKEENNEDLKFLNTKKNYLNKKIQELKNYINEINGLTKGNYIISVGYWSIPDATTEKTKTYYGELEELKNLKCYEYNQKIDKKIQDIKEKLIFKDDKEIKQLLEEFKKL